MNEAGNKTFKKHVLIIEDSQDLQFLLGRLFQKAGYTLSQAYDGQQALDMLISMSEKPSFILLDIMMPVMDGVAFREAQKKDPTLAHIPVVIMTADSDPDIRAKQLGVTYFFPKPIRSIDSLLEVAAKLTMSA